MSLLGRVRARRAGPAAAACEFYGSIHRRAMRRGAAPPRARPSVGFAASLTPPNAFAYGPPKRTVETRRMRKLIEILAATVLAISALPALAHHSNSAYQVDKIITLTGTVKEWRWMNPHTWLYLIVKDENGKDQEWAIEGRPPGILGRAGWSATILKPGDKVTVHASPAKNG